MIKPEQFDSAEHIVVTGKYTQTQIVVIDT